MHIIPKRHHPQAYGCGFCDRVQGIYPPSRHRVHINLTPELLILGAFAAVVVIAWALVQILMGGA